MTRIRKEFRCTKCNKIDNYEVDPGVPVNPFCCGRQMQKSTEDYVRGDPGSMPIDIIAMKHNAMKKIEWRQHGLPDEAWEVRCLRPGRPEGWRQASETIGWLGKRTLGYEYVMVAGIPEHKSGGFVTTRNGAIEAMIAAVS